jgi:hypothetical protein
MRLLLTPTLLSLFAVPALAHAADDGAVGSHPVAPEPHAAESSEPETGHSSDDAAPLEMRERWYGWQSLSADGAALVLLIAAGASSDQRNHLPDVFGYGSLGMYLLGGPATHLMHDSPGRALGSLAMRAGLPFAFGAIGFQLEDCSGDSDYDLCGFGGAILGGVLGIATAITIDAAVLSHEEVPVASRGVPNVGVSIGRDHAALVANGTF